MTHDFADGLLGGAINLFDVRASRGINGLGSSNPDSTLLSRQGAALDFSKVNVTLSRLQQLASTSVSLLIEATGQFAADRMVVSEQFGFGGERFGRAYDPSELLGDSGAAVRGELQFTPVSSSSSITGLQLYLFSDYGYIWNRPECGCGSPEASQASASSAGGGVRTNVTSHISGYLEAAEPLNRIVQAQGNKNPRVFASITVRY